MMSDIEKALFIEDVENFSSSNSLKDTIIEEELYIDEAPSLTFEEYLEWVEDLKKEIEDESINK